MSDPQPKKATSAESTAQGGLKSALAQLLRMPEGRGAKALKIAKLTGVLAMLMMPVTLMSWLAHLQEPIAVAEPTLVDALSAFDNGDIPLAQSIAIRLHGSDALKNDEAGGPPYILGAIAADQADRAPSGAKTPYDELAVRLLKEARSAGVPPGREAATAFLLGKSLARTQQFEQAKPLLEAAFENFPNEATLIHRLLGECYLKGEPPDIAKAVTHLEAYAGDQDLPLHLRDARLIQLAELLYRAGDATRCLSALDRVSTSAIGYSTTLVLRGRLLLDEASSIKATADTTDATQLSLADTKLHEAIKLFRRTQVLEVNLGKQVREAMYLIGRCYLVMGDHKQATDQFLKTRQMAPDSAEGIASGIEVAELLSKQGDRKKAVEAFCQLATGTPSENFENEWISLETLRSRVLAAFQSFLREEDYPSAVMLASNLEPLFPADKRVDFVAQAHRQWAVSLDTLAKKQLPAEAARTKSEAREHFRQAGYYFGHQAQIQFTTREYSDTIWNSAENYLAGHDFRNAIDAFNEYLRYEVRRRRPNALTGLGEAYLATGQLDRAHLALRECIEFYPRSAASHRARLLSAKVYREQNDPQQSELLLRENLEGELLTPAAAEWRESLFLLGNLLYDDGRYAEAIKVLQQAVGRYPDDPEAIQGHYLIAQAHRRSAIAPKRKLLDENSETVRNALQREINALLAAALAKFSEVQEMLTIRQQQTDLTPREQAIFRNCLFCRAATLADLGEYEEALRAYSAAANRYGQQPEVLDAFVQMMYCYKQLGREAEATGSLQQAKIALGRLKSGSDFTATTNYSRQEWLDLLTNLESL